MSQLPTCFRVSAPDGEYVVGRNGKPMCVPTDVLFGTADDTPVVYADGDKNNPAVVPDIPVEVLWPQGVTDITTP